ncbi:MAG: branched-chain amino acid ABC transporter permease [Humidesulfovibrio sp.]|nr:branched-chain amino acid ABC transporter permease [Humidesulfovibrio sp.]
MEDLLARYGFLIVTILQQALLGLSLYFPLMTGQLSLASIGFYSLGGYVAAVMGTHPALAPLREALGFSMYPLEWLVALLASSILGVVLGYPALRLRGIYLALATIAFVQILGVLALNMPITGGAIGIFDIPQPFESRLAYAWFFGPLLALTLFFLWRLERSGTGRLFFSIRENELAAGAMGVNVTARKVQAFVIGCALAGVVGAMSAPLLNTWNTRQGTFDAAVACLAYVLIGGARSKWGALLGAALLVSLPELLRPLKDSRMILDGLVLVLVCVYMPRGIAGLFDRRRA